MASVTSEHKDASMWLLIIVLFDMVNIHGDQRDGWTNYGTFLR